MCTLGIVNRIGSINKIVAYRRQNMYFLPLLAATTQKGSMLPTLLIYGALFAFMWFVLIRPQRKKQKETEMLQNALKVGDPVLLNSGMYGKIVDIVNNVIILELGTNKSVRVPVQRAGVISIAEPDLSIVKEEKEEA